MGRAAHKQLAHRGLTVGPHHQKVRVMLSRARANLLSDRLPRGLEGDDDRFDAVLGKSPDKVIRRAQCLIGIPVKLVLSAGLFNHEQLDRAGAANKRQGIVNGAGSFALLIPGEHHLLGRADPCPLSGTINTGRPHSRMT